MKPEILLSILSYEEALRSHVGPIVSSPIFSKIEVLLPEFDGIHIDVIRPPYSEVPRFSEGLMKELIHGLGRIQIEVHVMARDPMSILLKTAAHNLTGTPLTVSVHVEDFENASDAIEALRKIRLLGWRPGLAVDTATSVGELREEVVAEAELIHLMAVPAGRGGQKFHPEVVEKIRRIREAFPTKLIEVDGGINEETGKEVINAGARRLVVGSRVTESVDPLRTIRVLKESLMI